METWSLVTSKWMSQRSTGTICRGTSATGSRTDVFRRKRRESISVNVCLSIKKQEHWSARGQILPETWVDFQALEQLV